MSYRYCALPILNLFRNCICYITYDMAYVIYNVTYTEYGMFGTSSISYTNIRCSNSIIHDDDILCY